MLKTDKLTVRIRMYRHGLGDCFLLTFSKKGIDPFNMLIDCGLLQGTGNGTAIMNTVAASIEDSLTLTKSVNGETKKWLDVVVLTHEHVDHISGFKLAKDVFDRIHFGEVWAGWTEDEGHPKYKAVRERFGKQVTGLKAAMSKMTSDKLSGIRTTIGFLLEDFFDQELVGAAADPLGRSPAWSSALDKSIDNPRYCNPGDTFILDSIGDIRIYVLGPPLEFESFTKVNPPHDETYRQSSNNFALSDSFFAAVADDSGFFEPELYQPFERHIRIKKDVVQTSSDYKDFFKDHYGFTSTGLTIDNADWRRIDDDWLSTAGGLALNLDSYTNNTCLALAIEFVSTNQVLLFPGDAQFANWISWQNLVFEIPDGNGGKRKIRAEDLLEQTILYKVGHHGSHNATLKKHGLEMMINPQLVAMIPVNMEMARSKTSKTNPQGWEMPEHNLMARLQELTRNRVIQADDDSSADLEKRGCKDAKFLANVTFGGSFVRDPTVSTKKESLYIDFTLQI